MISFFFSEDLLLVDGKEGSDPNSRGRAEIFSGHSVRLMNQTLRYYTKTTPENETLGCSIPREGWSAKIEDNMNLTNSNLQPGFTI